MGCRSPRVGLRRVGLRRGLATRGLYLAANDHLRLGGHAVPHDARRQPSQVVSVRKVAGGLKFSG